MELKARARPVVLGYGQSANEPKTAAKVVGATAVAFTVLWTVSILLFTYVSSIAILGLLMIPATVANAYFVTYVVWQRFVPDEPWSYLRGLGVGLVIGVVSHVTIGFVWSLPLSAFAVLTGRFEPIGNWGALGTVVGQSLLISLVSIFVTYGIPIVLSVTCALGLTYARKRAAA